MASGGSDDMSAHAYTEDQLVEQPAIGLFAEYSEGPTPHPRPFSHREKVGRHVGLRVRSLVLVSRLRAALERLNPALPPEAITAVGVIPWQAARPCKVRISSRFLF